ncbi:MAG: 5'-3' exonuclease H3TH domain-containing protein [Candidatus Pacebacteria bacterium]|nr:5'-3' exonuclease H3TH domain-containing protein [Candidatus Paceibacterota bacterium]
MKKLLLIDANSLIHRCFHALPPLTTPKGEPINAIYGLSSILLKVLRDHNPDYMAAAFDRAEPTFRDDMYKDYKAHRPPTDDKLVPQLQKAHEVFEKFGIKVVDRAGFEADDIIGTLAEMFKDEDEINVIIFSGDKDNLQLIEDKKVFVELLRTGVSKTIMFDENLFRQEYGFSPKQLIDYKAIIGDASDNIPGVRGIGPKGALELIRDYGSVEKIYEEVGLIPKKKIQEHLEQSRESAFLSKKLATIKKDIPLQISLEDLKQKPIDKESLRIFFEELGFRSLVERL